MKKFNQEIQVTVQVDTIATNLLNSFNESFPHREMLTETIIGLGLENGNISLIYNNLMGFSNDIDFEINQLVSYNGNVYNHFNTGTIDEPIWTEKHEPVGLCTIVDINNVKSDKVQISYTYADRRGVTSNETSWVNHTRLSIPA